MIAYLEWRAGESWRIFGRAGHRSDPERWDYLDAVRLIETIRYAEPRRPQLALPGLPTSPTPSKQVKSLAGRPRAWLVDRLLQAKPSLTDRKLLTHLGRLKLATMLAGARSEARRTA